MEEQDVKLSDSDIEIITKSLQERALQLEEQDGDQDLIDTINRIAYYFQEHQRDPKLRDKP